MYPFPELCGYDHAMRDIADSDIEYDLGEINTSISVDEAHSHGLARIRDNQRTETVSLLRRRSCSRRELPQDTHLVFPSPGYGAAFWQDEGSMQCSPSDQDVRASTCK